MCLCEKLEYPDKIKTVLMITFCLPAFRQTKYCPRHFRPFTITRLKLSSELVATCLASIVNITTFSTPTRTFCHIVEKLTNLSTCLCNRNIICPQLSSVTSEQISDYG